MGHRVGFYTFYDDGTFYSLPSVNSTFLGAATHVNASTDRIDGGNLLPIYNATAVGYGAFAGNNAAHIGDYNVTSIGGQVWFNFLVTPRHLSINIQSFFMANPAHLKTLLTGPEAWNKWRRRNSVVSPDLSGASLRGLHVQGAYLAGVDFQGADLRELVAIGGDLQEADFSGANLSSANLSECLLNSANFREAVLYNANLSRTHLNKVNLRKAYLSEANLRLAYLTEADLSGAEFIATQFIRTSLSGADFSGSVMEHTTFTNIDLSEAKGLENVKHYGPSSVGIDTLYLSKGKIPEVFLRGCGVPEDFICYIPSLVGAEQVIQFYSCFISYSTQDEEFTKRLHSRMRDAQLRVWFAPEDLKGGNKLNPQIEDAIQMNDRLLLVLTESSMRSPWVTNEIRKARRAEKRQNRRKLFPIRLVPYDTIKNWDEINPDIDIEIAEEIQKYFIPDFTNWKDHDAFEAAFARLLRDLKAEEQKK